MIADFTVARKGSTTYEIVFLPTVTFDLCNMGRLAPGQQPTAQLARLYSAELRLSFADPHSPFVFSSPLLLWDARTYT